MAKSPETSWMHQAAKKMAREGKNLLVVVDELGIPGMRPQEIEQVYRSDMFQQLLRAEKNRYALEIAGDPTLQKQTAIGFMVIAIQNLMSEGEWDKALEGWQKLAKLAGWQGSDSVNIFAELKPKDLDVVKAQIYENMKKAGLKN